MEGENRQVVNSNFLIGKGELLKFIGNLERERKEEKEGKERKRKKIQ